MRLRLPRPSYTLLLLLALPGPTCAAASTPASNPDSPVGRWKTFDDSTGKASAIVQIREANGVLTGRIVKLFDPPAPNPLCIKCTGRFKNQPVMGMRILWGMRKEDNEWNGGEVLDPESGNIYRCTITVDNNGNVLHLRGYIGTSIFGRTEKWLRSGGSGTQ